jgi:hypothetical protein
MRSLKLTLILCALMLLLTPTRAHAWWEWLDYLSGPGPFVGPRVDFRWCPGGGTAIHGKDDKGFYTVDLMTVDTKLSRSASSLQILFASTGKANAISTLQDAEARNGTLRSILSSFDEIGIELKRINSQFPVIGTELGDFERTTGELKDHLRQVLDLTQPAATRPELNLLVVFVYSTSAIAAADAALDRVKNGLVSLGATGILISFCDPGKLRTFAIDGGISSLHTFSSDKWAGGHTIWLNALTAGVSIRPYASTNVSRDYFDLGVTGGVYIFSSGGIDSTFSVPVLTPFVDFHAPTKTIYQTGAKYWLSRFTVRAGFVLFTEDIPASKFNGVGQSDITKVEAKRITLTVYYNLWPKLRRRTDRLPEAFKTSNPTEGPRAPQRKVPDALAASSAIN